MVELDDDPAVSLAGDGLILWGTLVGGGYAVGAMRTAGWFTLSPIAEIGYWSIILVIGWVGSVVLGMRARRHHHSTLPPAALATMIALPGGITFTLYFMFALGGSCSVWSVAFRVGRTCPPRLAHTVRLWLVCPFRCRNSAWAGKSVARSSYDPGLWSTADWSWNNPFTARSEISGTQSNERNREKVQQ
jgi:hypothetical protein